MFSKATSSTKTSSVNELASGMADLATGKPAGSAALNAPQSKTTHYPQVFDSRAICPSAYVQSMAIDWTSPHQNSRAIFESLDSTEPMEEVLSHLRATLSRADFKRLFEATGILCAAQNVVKSYRENKRAIGPFSFLARVTLPHLRSMRVMSTQYGLSRYDLVGEIYELPNFEAQVWRSLRYACRVRLGPQPLPRPLVAAGLRVAPAAQTTEHEWRQYCDATSILPHRVDGKISDLQIILRGYLQETLVSWGYTYILVEAGLPILTGVEPPWWAWLTDAHKLVLAPLFEGVPATAAGWTRWINSLSQDWFDSCTMICTPTGPGTWTDDDFAFTTDWKHKFQEILEEWAIPTDALATKFMMGDVSAAATVGSVEQTSSVDITPEGLVCVEGWAQSLATSRSLTAFFPCEAFYPKLVRPRAKRSTTRTQYETERTKWIRRDFLPS